MPRHPHDPALAALQLEVARLSRRSSRTLILLAMSLAIGAWALIPQVRGPESQTTLRAEELEIVDASGVVRIRMRALSGGGVVEMRSEAGYLLDLSAIRRGADISLGGPDRQYAKLTVADGGVTLDLSDQRDVVTLAGLHVLPSVGARLRVQHGLGGPTSQAGLEVVAERDATLNMSHYTSPESGEETFKHIGLTAAAERCGLELIESYGERKGGASIELDRSGRACLTLTDPAQPPQRTGPRCEP